MRRMLDPKELGELGGGGGGEGVYMYGVKITGISSQPATLIFNVIANHTGLLTNESVGNSETFTKNNDLHAFFSKLATIWPSNSYSAATTGPYILATGTFGTGSNIKDIHYGRYNKLSNFVEMYQDEDAGNSQSIGEGNTKSIIVQRIM